MAVVSNTCNGSLGSDCKVYLEYKINNSEADRIQRNKSNITLHLYAQATENIPTYNNNGNCSANIKINGSTKTNSSSLSMDFRNKKRVEMLTWTGDVSHGVDGKLTITISGSFDTNGPSGVTTGSVSKSWALPTIPRASSVTCADGNIGSATTININRASNSFTHTLTYSFNGLTGTIATKTTNTSIGWTIPTSFYSKIPNAKSGKVTITCQTYSGNTLIGTKTTTANVFVVNSEPTVSATIVDINPVSLALTEDENKLIKYISNAQINVLANAQNSATIASIKVVNGSRTKTTAESTIEAVDSGTFTITCTDSRGFVSAPLVVTKEMIEYIKPVITDLQLARPTTTSNTVQAVLSGQFYNGLLGYTNNNIELKFRYKSAEDNAWSNYSTLTPVVSENKFNIEETLGDIFNYQNSYNFEFVVTDAILSYTSQFTVTQGIPIIDIGKNDVKFSKQIFMGENKVEVQRSIISLTIDQQSGNPTKQINTTWTDIKLDMNTLGFKKGQTFSHSNNAILINKDCDVMVSGEILFRGIEKTKILTIRRKRNNDYTLISSGYATDTSNIWSTISLINRPISCIAGDIIELCVGSQITGTLEIGRNEFTLLTVQEL